LEQKFQINGDLAWSDPWPLAQLAAGPKLHRYGGLKLSVVYRVPDDLNDLNGLNCLNEQRSLPSGFDEGLVSGDRRWIRRKIETEPKIRKWFQRLTRLTTGVKI
jgi:hypothetical protein